jgi:hypothetical protein
MPSRHGSAGLMQQLTQTNGRAAIEHAVRESGQLLS